MPKPSEKIALITECILNQKISEELVNFSKIEICAIISAIIRYLDAHEFSEKIIRKQRLENENKCLSNFVQAPKRKHSINCGNADKKPKRKIGN